MARRYDSRTTVFSPEGRLFQVEYALKAIDHAGAVVGILTKHGIVLGAERKVTSKLLENVVSDKMALIDNHIAVCVAGITADANILVNYLREQAQGHRMKYDSPIPVERLVQTVCDMKQGYTQYGGLRPFGVSLLYAGFDSHFGLQLYQSDPSGNYGGWRATAIGSNNAQAQSLLKQEYKEDISLDDAVKLALKVLHKTMDATTLTVDKVDFATLTRGENGQMVYKLFPKTEVEELIKNTDLTSTGNAE